MTEDITNTTAAISPHGGEEAGTDPRFLEMETAYTEEVSGLWAEETDLRARIRRNHVDAEPAERLAAYVEEHRRIEEGFDRAAARFCYEVEKDRQSLRGILFGGGGPGFASHLTQVAGVPDERLEELMAVATRTGQRDLARAVAQVAYQRGEPFGLHHGLFSEWAASDPQTAKALQRLRSMPDRTEVERRAVAARPPVERDAALLEPTSEDVRAHREEQDAREASRLAWFSVPKIKVNSGRGTREIVDTRRPS